MRWIAGAVVLLGVAGCPAPGRYIVEQPGLSCDRATRVAYRTMVGLGFRVDELVAATPDAPGVVAGTKAGAGGAPTVGRVRIRCDPAGVVLQPVENPLVPANYEFSREFGYSFRTLVQRPDVEVPNAEVGLEVLVHVIPPPEARLDLGGEAIVGDAVLVRVTVRNFTDRAIEADGADVDVVRADGTTVRPLAGAARAAVLAPTPGGDRVRAEPLGRARLGPRTTRGGFLVFPPGAYREARLTVTDVETGETDGFVAPVQ